MITLAVASQTTSTTVFNGVTTVNTTDTLFISYIEIGFDSGSVSAFIQKGTMVNGVFTSNLPKIRVNVNPDGSFSSNDPAGPNGGWSGIIPNWSATLAALAAPLDGLLVAAALVQGTATPNTALTAVQAVPVK
jgi:hypothetical protein